MAQKIAFKAASEDLSGATASIADGLTFDIAAALKDGGGTIVLDLDNSDDRDVAEILNTHPAVVKAAPSKKESK
jgi:hypothetical protein